MKHKLRKKQHADFKPDSRRASPHHRSRYAWVLRYIRVAGVSASVDRAGASQVGWARSAHAVILDFALSPPVRRRVAQPGQGMSARTDETTSHSTKLANDASQVAGYV